MLPKRKMLQHDVPAWVETGPVCFLTLSCAERRTHRLGDPGVAATIFEAVEFRQRTMRWYGPLFVLMPDHLHAPVSFPALEGMRAVVANFKAMTAKKAGDAGKSPWVREVEVNGGPSGLALLPA
ncbi:MAG: hypothetical protein C0518_15020 [Opitutus sp.]|nr:hypothetical protein [Opitutus sp.]